MAMGRPSTTGSRAGYGAEINGMLADYCQAVDGVARRDLVKAAIRHYIAYMCDGNAIIGKRYAALQKQRYPAGDKPNLQLVKKPD